MRKLGILCFLCLLASCDWFTSKESKTKKLVDAALEEIDWNDVDQYPLFSDCDETADKAIQKQCFENTLLLHFSMTLQDFEFVMDNTVDDTIYVDFLVDRYGTIAILEIAENNKVKQQIPEFNTIVSQSLRSLPRLEPALKRGIPVGTKFRIPIVLSTD